MEWTDDMIKQCAKPCGELGRFVGERMNESHSELWQWGLSHISIKDNSTILDVGCGGGGAINLLASFAIRSRILGIDFSKEMVELAKKINHALIANRRVEILYGEVLYLPFADNTFDVVTAFETYYFWLNIVNCLKEIKRVLKTGGIIIMVNETYKHPQFEEKNSHLAKLLNMEYHTPNEFIDLLQVAGYSTVEVFTIPEKNWITAAGKKN